MARPKKPKEQTPAQADPHESEEQHRELLGKLTDQAQPAEERGERVDTARTIATGGKEAAPEAEDNQGE
jgi:hypothetical protein